HSVSIFPMGTPPPTPTPSPYTTHFRSCTFTVTVTDTERPVPSCPGNLTVSAAPGQCATNASFAFSFTDNCPGGSILCVPASGSSFAKGTNSVTCTATDASGNSSNCTFTVT